MFIPLLVKILGAMLMGAGLLSLQHPEVAKSALPSVGIILVEHPNGAPTSGTVFVAGDHLLVTADHVAQKAGNILVKFRESEWLEAKVVESDPINDVAVLSYSGPDIPPLPLADFGKVKPGDYVAVMAFPSVEDLRKQARAQDVQEKAAKAQTAVEGTVRAIRGALLVITTEDVPRNGGPVLNLTGEVIGIVRGRLQVEAASWLGYGYAAPSYTIRPTLAAAELKHPSEPTASAPTTAQAVGASTPESSQPTTSAPQVSPPPPEPSASITNRLYMVRVGPVSDRDRAAAIVKQLLAGGFSKTKVTSQTGFRVVSEPLPRSAAEDLSATLAGRGIRSRVESLGGNTAQVLFGAFTSQKEAETLAQRIGAAGYDAWVREGVIYLLDLGPYPQPSVDTITGIVKSGAPDATVTADPPLPTLAQAPQGSPATSSQPPSPSAPSGTQPAAAVPKQLVPSASSSVAVAPFLIVPGQSVGPVRLGRPAREETAGLGASKGSVELDDGTMMYRWFEPPSNAGIGVRTAQNDTVLRAWVLNDERYRTKEGLHVGSTEAEVRAALGVPTRVEFSSKAKTRTLIYESLGLWFSIQLDQQYNFYNAVFDIGVMAKK
jgi:S1-C subfamily serine protease